MKKIIHGALRHNGKTFAFFATASKVSLIAIAVLLTGIFFTACQKQSSEEILPELQSSVSQNSNRNALNLCTGLSPKTLRELQQARAATARYRHIENAIRDGYADIAVDVENMGHHYMKTKIVDDKFDIRHPEILVYNRNKNGKLELVAVEYAVPLTNPVPEGFSGSGDVWNGSSGFPFWLLHAWVWAYNPDGVFNPTNPLIHLH